MARSSIALVVSVRKIPGIGHSLRLADLESPSGTEERRVSLVQRSALAITSPWGWQLHIPSESKDQERETMFVSARIPHSDCGWCPAATAHWSSLTVDAVWMGGWAVGQAAASQPQQSKSASAGRPCEKPCVRECRCLSQAGVGSAMENMRTERDATEAERLSVSIVGGQKCWLRTWNVSPDSGVVVYDDILSLTAVLPKA